MQNVRPGNVTEFSSVEAIKQCILAGMGLGLLPAMVVARVNCSQHQLKALHWAGTPLDIDTYILWHKVTSGYRRPWRRLCSWCRRSWRKAKAMSRC